MLVLTRKLYETVRIGTDIEVQIVRMDGSRVQLGITAPDDVLILRGEVPDNRQAVGIGGGRAECRER